jgi:ABC-type sugar transport system permease subunit
MLLSPVVVALIWKWILQREGVLNALVQSAGGTGVEWLNVSGWAFSWTVFVSIWAHMGFYTLILLAGLQAIPAELYEAAQMDHASPWRRFSRITLPLLMPNLLVVVVLALIRAVQVFDEVFVLTGGGPGSATLFVVQFIYQTAFAESIRLYGIAAAASLVLALALLVLNVVQLRCRAARLKAAQERAMPSIRTLLTATHGRGRLDWTDWVTYGYLCLGLLLMFGPVLWLVMSSFKTAAALNEFPPRFLPYGQKSVTLAGRTDAAPVYRVRLPDGTTREMAELRRIGIQATMVNPAHPEEEIKVNIRDRESVREFRLATENYTEIFGKFDFSRFLWNSVFITVVATLITLLFNAMAAFALSKYRFRGRRTAFIVILATLMIRLPSSPCRTSWSHRRSDC